MRHNQLRAFHHVALHGGFSRAAKALNMTQPSLSDQVRRLEQEYDVLLFHREARAVRLTAAGEELFRLTSELFEVEDRARALLDRRRTAVAGTLRIVADSVLHIITAVGRFRARHPRVFVSIHAGNSREVLERLRNYEAEIGVIGAHAPAPDLDLIELGTTPIVAVAPRGHPATRAGAQSLRQLAAYPLVLREPGSRTRASVEAEAARAGVTLSPALEVEGREAMREVVATGAGIGFVSEIEFGHDARLERIAIEGMEQAMPESLVTLKARRDVPAIRAFVQAVRDAALDPAAPEQ